MKSQLSASAVGSALLLVGCATTDKGFSVPTVDTAYVLEDNGTDPRDCGFAIKPKGPTAKNPESSKKIKHTFQGANHLIDNYLMVYRCAARHSANSRQMFELPALVVGAGGATAAALGAPAAVAILGGASVATLNGANSYYSPKDRTRILLAAVDGLTCIKNEAVGMDSYGTTLIDRANPDQKNDEGSGDHGGPKSGQPGVATNEDGEGKGAGATIAVSAAYQYLALVQGALFSVENIAAQRLNTLGSYAPDSLISEIKQLASATEAAKPTSAETTAATADAAKVLNEAPPETPPFQEEVVQLSEDGGEQRVKVESDAAEQLIDPRTRLLSTKVSRNLIMELGNPHAYLALDAKGAPTVRRDTSSPPAGSASRAAVAEVLLLLKDLQPRLAECVVRTKL